LEILEDFYGDCDTYTVEKVLCSFFSIEHSSINGVRQYINSLIKEMDQKMTLEFEKTFKVINEHFKETFKELFKGGSAELKLTDPSNLLETGVDIVASPPGKKLSSISLLSGGEKSLTAISLLFAIIKSRTSPFCILDEV